MRLVQVLAAQAVAVQVVKPELLQLLAQPIQVQVVAVQVLAQVLHQAMVVQV
jgi:hypothetical protein